MGLLDTLKSFFSSRQKAVAPGMFAFLAPSAMPSIKDRCLVCVKQNKNANRGVRKRLIAERLKLFNEGKKKCYVCKQIKEITHFYKNRTKKDGYVDVCAKCKKEYYYKNRERKQNWSCLKLYGITLEQKRQIFIRQNGKCANPECKKELKTLQNGHVDHDHKNKKVRGILCYRCNLMLGMVNDDPKILQGAIQYLQENQNSDSYEYRAN